MLVAVVSSVAALVGVAVGALLPDLLAARRAAQARYDVAITAVARLQADRHGAGLNIQSHLIRAPDAAAGARTVHDLSTEGVRRYLESAAASRAALAALQPWSPDLRTYWDQFEVTEAQFDSLLQTLVERRRHPLRQHGQKTG